MSYRREGRTSQRLIERPTISRDEYGIP